MRAQEPSHTHALFARLRQAVRALALAFALAAGLHGTTAFASGDVTSETVVRPPPPPPTAEQLMDWAETAYAEYFPGHQASRTAAPYVSRHYPATGNYLGVAGTGIYILGPVAGSATVPVYVGELSAYACHVFPAECGTKTIHRVTLDGLLREFIVYLPWKAQQPLAGPVPAVFMLHGTTGDGERFFNISGWREKADVEGLVAVFPSALVHCFFEDDNRDGTIAANERKVTTKWSAGSLGEADQRPLCTAEQIAQLPAAQRALADHPLADDMAFFTRMLDYLPTAYPVDTRRIYASGFSNGGEMTSRLAAQMSTRFAAVAAAAGHISVPATPAARRLSVVFSVGSVDPGFVAAYGYAGSLPLDASLSGSAGFSSRVVTPWTSVLGLATGFTWTSPTPYGVRASRFLYDSSPTQAGNRLAVLVIDGADHQYPNGSNHPVKMAELLWEFFKAESLP